MSVEVFADVSCPFTHVVLQRWLARRRELGRDDVRLRVKAWPLELVNGSPPDGSLVAEEIDDLHRQVRSSAPLFAGFRADRFPSSTLPAMRLTSAAYGVSDEVGEAVAFELRNRLLERGEDVADPALLTAVARAHALDPSAADEPTNDGDDPVRVEWAEGQRRGVEGSPHFFAGDLDAFCPSLRIDHDGDRLRIDDVPGDLDPLVRASFR
jgi:predicted DsbA family dithiol-disulfide isomerase